MLKTKGRHAKAATAPSATASKASTAESGVQKENQRDRHETQLHSSSSKAMMATQPSGVAATSLAVRNPP